MLYEAECETNRLHHHSGPKRAVKNSEARIPKTFPDMNLTAASWVSAQHLTSSSLFKFTVRIPSYLYSVNRMISCWISVTHWWFCTVCIHEMTGCQQLSVFKQIFPLGYTLPSLVELCMKQNIHFGASHFLHVILLYRRKSPHVACWAFFLEGLCSINFYWEFQQGVLDLHQTEASVPQRCH